MSRLNHTNHNFYLTSVDHAKKITSEQRDFFKFCFKLIFSCFTDGVFDCNVPIMLAILKMGACAIATVLMYFTLVKNNHQKFIDQCCV